MKKTFLFLIFSGLIILFTSCGQKRASGSLEDKIYVIADSTEYSELNNILDSVFGKIIYTPQPEKIFQLVRKDFNSFNDIKTAKNILIVAPLNSSSNVSRYINSILDDKVRNEVKSNYRFVFNKYNLWTHDQLVMIMTAPTTNQLKKNILENGASLLYYFQNMSNKRLSKNLYNDRYENKEAEAKLLKDYGWIIYVQPDYIVADNDTTDNFVTLQYSKGEDMEKWIFIHWIDNASPEFMHPDSIIKERNKLTEQYYKSADKTNYVKIAGNYKTTNEVNFLGKYALATQGLWEMTDQSRGGPFINYTFYDEAARRIYMLDGAIYAPKYIKKALIQQVDVILQSFQTQKQISEYKKKELLGFLSNNVN